MRPESRGLPPAGVPSQPARLRRAAIAFSLVGGLIYLGQAPAAADLRSRVESLQQRLNHVASLVGTAQTTLAGTQSLVRSARRQVATARERLDRARAGIRGLAREMYILGPGSFAEIALGQSDFGDFADRLRFAERIRSHHRDVIERVGVERRRLVRMEGSLEDERDRQAAILGRLRAQRNSLTALFRQQSALLRTSSAPVIRAGGTLELCPVDRPRAYSNDFGAPRGGGRRHQGIDILAPRGTPIRAPFDGRAERRYHALSGQAVRVYGKGGYVFNAHLNAYGASGSVRAGDVVGYVGNTGNASGGPTHDHFEWHPGGGGAVNPYSMLNSVC